MTLAPIGLLWFVLLIVIGAIILLWPGFRSGRSWSVEPWNVGIAIGAVIAALMVWSLSDAVAGNGFVVVAVGFCAILVGLGIARMLRVSRSSKP